MKIQESDGGAMLMHSSAFLHTYHWKQLMEIRQRTVSAVSNDVSRFGHVIPSVTIVPEVRDDILNCIAVPGSSFQDITNIFNLKSGDKIDIIPTLHGINHIVGCHYTPRSAWSYQTTYRCSSCDTPLVPGEFGFICLDPSCLKRLVSRMVFMGSQEGLSIPVLTFNKCNGLVFHDHISSLDELFESSFAFRNLSTFDINESDQLNSAISMLKRHIRHPGSLSTLAALYAALIHSLSLPGFTPTIIRRIIEEVIYLKEDPFPFIVSALTQPEIMTRLGISVQDATNASRGSEFYIDELASIHGYIFDQDMSSYQKFYHA